MASSDVVSRINDQLKQLRKLEKSSLAISQKTEVPAEEIPQDDSELTRLKRHYKTLKKQYRTLESFIRTEREFELDEAASRVKSLQATAASAAKELRSAESESTGILQEIKENPGADALIKTLIKQTEANGERASQLKAEIASLTQELNEIKREIVQTEERYTFVVRDITS